MYRQSSYSDLDCSNPTVDGSCPKFLPAETTLNLLSSHTLNVVAFLFSTYFELSTCMPKPEVFKIVLAEGVLEHDLRSIYRVDPLAPSSVASW